MKLQLTTGAVVFLAICAGQTSAEDVGLLVSCSMENGAYERVYLLYPSNFLAQRVDGAEAVYGQFVDLDYVYKLDFLGTDTQPPHRARIFRYTGKIEVEWGTQPFDMYSGGNTFQTGVCQTSKAQKMF
jgi:hypothetical protein